MSRSRLQAGCAIALAVVGVAVAGAGPATAHDKAFDSRITINHPTESRYRGRVFSESPRCVASRLVKFYYSTGELVNTTKTDAEGRWSYSFLGTTGYYARVTREVRGGAGHRHVCKADRSPTVSGRSARRIRRVKTTVTIKDYCGGLECRVAARRNYTATFFGRVKSRVDRCERRRTVSLYRQQGKSDVFEKIDETKSGADGGWEIVRTDKPGFVDYFVRVRAARRGDVVCRAAKSAREPHDFPS